MTTENITATIESVNPKPWYLSNTARFCMAGLVLVGAKALGLTLEQADVLPYAEQFQAALGDGVHWQDLALFAVSLGGLFFRRHATQPIYFIPELLNRLLSKPAPAVTDPDRPVPSDAELRELQPNELRALNQPHDNRPSSRLCGDDEHRDA